MVFCLCFCGVRSWLCYCGLLGRRERPPMKREGIMVGEKFLPADVIEHILNLRRLGVQKDTWKGHDGYSWTYTCMPEGGYISIACQDSLFEFGTSAAWSVAIDEYLKLLD